MWNVYACGTFQKFSHSCDVQINENVLTFKAGIMYISEFNSQNSTRFANWQDVKNCQLYIINGIVVDFFDGGVRPTSTAVMDAWKSMHGNEERLFTFVDIDWIIAKVEKFYN